MLATRTDELVETFERLAAEARRGGRRCLVSVTVEIDTGLDPSAVAFASRRADDRWFCWEQPDREGFALAGLGTAVEVVSRGERRFADVEESCRRALQDHLASAPEGLPPGVGPVWVGGFSFSSTGCGEPQWSSLPQALMTIPELSLARVGESAYLTVVAIAGERGADEIAAGLRRRLASLRADELPMLDPHPTSRPRLAGPRTPGQFEEAVDRATAQIRHGDLEKVVLAREVTVEAPAAHDPGALLGALRELFPSCFCFCAGTPEAAFVGASPELLVRRGGAVAATAALAGSARRSADPAIDDHLGEQLLRSPKERSEHEIVARRIVRALGSHAVWVEAAAEPELVRVANIQHLGTAIHAQLADARSAIELAGMLHPTPAVGGEPEREALATIEELEGMDRGWYAGPVGWMDATEDGEFCVALRSALLRDRTAHLYAGGGIVADSDPVAELAETEVKLEALLPLLAG